MTYGWAGKILRVDLTDRKTIIQDVRPYSECFIGGEGINVKIIYDQIGRDVSPFDPDNIFCIATGVLGGSPAPASSRSTITAVSPRGLLDSAGIGGFFGAEMKYTGYDQIVVVGKSDRPVYVYVTDKGVQIKDAGHLWGKDPWQTQQLIREELGDRDIQSISIGQAGENRVHYACVVTGRLSSAAGRCGMGAIMGSKNLKALAVRGKRGLKIAHPQKYLEACLELHQSIRASAAFEKKRDSTTDKVAYSRYIDIGKFFPGNWEDSNWMEDGFGGLLKDADEFWEKEALHLKPNGARQSGCFGCPMYHETNFHIPGVKDIGRTKCIQWHSVGEVVWLKDRRKVIEATYLCDSYGLDAVSAGGCISFLMELHHKGIISKEDTDGIAMKRGDMSAVKFALAKIARQEGFGRYLKGGVAAAARHFGKDAQKCAMQTKGLELFHQDIRSFKSKALLSAVGKMEQLSLIEDLWPDNRADMEKLAKDTFGRSEAAVSTSYEDKALLTFDSENRHCIGDLLGICKFYIPWGQTQSFDAALRLLPLITGEKVELEDLLTAAKRVFLLKRAFNALRGIRRKDERPPRRMFEKPVTDGKFKGQVLHRESFEKMLTEYYQLRGCDQEGVPRHESFEKLGLVSEWDRFKGEMKKAGTPDEQNPSD